MPHIHLEYSKNIAHGIKLSSLFHELHNLVSQTANAEIGNCMSRAIQIDNFFIGNCNPKNALLNLEIQLMKGRSEIILKKLGDEIVNLLKKYYMSHMEKYEIKISVKIIEILPELYYKNP